MIHKAVLTIARSKEIRESLYKKEELTPKSRSRNKFFARLITSSILKNSEIPCQEDYPKHHKMHKFKESGLCFC